MFSGKKNRRNSDNSTKTIFVSGKKSKLENRWSSVLFFCGLISIFPDQPVCAHSKFLQCEFIRPPTSFCDIQLWSECYLRWIPPANGKNSGKLGEELSLDEKMIEMAKKWNSSEWKMHLDLPEEVTKLFGFIGSKHIFTFNS